MNSKPNPNRVKRRLAGCCFLYMEPKYRPRKRVGQKKKKITQTPGAQSQTRQSIASSATETSVHAKRTTMAKSNSSQLVSSAETKENGDIAMIRKAVRLFRVHRRSRARHLGCWLKPYRQILSEDSRERVWNGSLVHPTPSSAGAPFRSLGKDSSQRRVVPVFVDMMNLNMPGFVSLRLSSREAAYRCRLSGRGYLCCWSGQNGHT